MSDNPDTAFTMNTTSPARTRPAFDTAPLPSATCARCVSRNCGSAKFSDFIVPGKTHSESHTSQGDGVHIAALDVKHIDDLAFPNVEGGVVNNYGQ
jgi:hypothetical protein